MGGAPQGGGAPAASFSRLAPDRSPGTTATQRGLSRLQPGPSFARAPAAGHALPQQPVQVDGGGGGAVSRAARGGQPRTPRSATAACARRRRRRTCRRRAPRPRASPRPRPPAGPPRAPRCSPGPPATWTCAAGAPAIVIPNKLRDAPGRSAVRSVHARSSPGWPAFCMTFGRLGWADLRRHKEKTLFSCKRGGRRTEVQRRPWPRPLHHKRGDKTAPWSTSLMSG